MAKYNGSLSVIIPENSIVPATLEKIYFPTAYTDNNKETVRLSDIRVYQGNNAYADKNTFIGNIQMPKIYAHNRELDDIPIQIKFMVTVTTVDVFIRIPASTKDIKEIFVKKSIHLEEK